MKVCLISPPFPFSGRVPMAPPILEYLGALTLRAMPDAKLTLIDANVREPMPEDIDADLVGITSMTATVTWAYRFGDDLRRFGKKVVLGGIHPSALPDEAKGHADSIVVGEAESVWADVLNDALKGRLKPFYRGERLPLDDIPFPLAGVLKGNYKFRAVFTARGCPYRCTFCSVRKFFGDTIRYRPIDKVVEEIERCTGKVYFNGDDNIWGGDIRRSIELFTEISKGTRKWWYGFGDLRATQEPNGDRLLKAARDSGLFSVWVGWETLSQRMLNMYRASAKQGKNREDAVKKIKGYGIDVTLFVVIGGREDTTADFDRIIELAERLGVGIHPVLLTPLPGTELYEEYKPYLFKGKGWEYYAGVHAVFEHPTMTPKERESMFYKASLRLLSKTRIMKHLFDIRLKGFPMTHLLSLMKQIPMKRAMEKAYKNWKAENYRFTK
ncbi:MAG: B12-binding domain-containing radical SAM protein [Nitrospirae bacterium]|nr:B12-binding domain-containing radical SAM protein [Nitrospirota bacterium]